MSKLVRVVLMMMVLAVPIHLGLMNFALLEPYLFPLHLAQQEVMEAGARSYGPFPNDKTLNALKTRGVLTVVSLLDPDLIYERSLLDQERQETEKLGLRFHDFPMSSDEPPDSPRNAAAIAAVRALVKSAPHSPVYIHCYLGKHRSRTVMAAIEGKR